MFGDQTDVPESADWWDAAYLMMWGSNVPVTRTPDAHFMTEVRYRGTKVVAVAPDYADNVKFADEWVPAAPGTDAALAIAMGHVILKEFFVEKNTPEFSSYVATYTDLPFLVRLETREIDGREVLVPGKFLMASDLGDTSENADFKPMLLDGADDPNGVPVVPGGSLGHRFGEEGKGKWNLDLGDIRPLLTTAGDGAGGTEVALPRFDTLDGTAATMIRGVPTREIEGQLVCTVFDLLLAQYGVAREGLPGQWPAGYEDPDGVGTPEWQETFTGVPAAQCIRIAREFAGTARDSGGRCMIIMGAGTNHWFHSDTIYRTFLTLTTLTGCQGKNGGGWAHYVGQEKVRPHTGFSQMAFALDWQRPPRQNISAAFFYLHTGQWRYDSHGADAIAAATGTGMWKGKSPADLLAASARMGWMPSFPTLAGNILDHCDAAKAEGMAPKDYIVRELTSGRLKFVAEDPDGEHNHPKVLTVWRSNLMGSSSKGNEYFNKILLGTDHSLRAEPAGEGHRGSEVTWNPDLPEGKLDLLMCLDFRMTSTTLFSDLVFPAATWYEKYDLSSTDMHPYVHSFNPAINPPWQAKSDYVTFKLMAEKVSELAATHLGTRTDLVLAPLQHDTPDAMAYPRGVAKDWRAGECDPVPGKTMPKMVEVERDYTTVAQKWGAIGPLASKLGMVTKGVTYDPTPEVEMLRGRNGKVRGGIADGQPALTEDRHMCEAILAFSGTTNGRLATEGWKQYEERTGMKLADLSADEAGKRITFTDTQVAPQSVITSPEWSGSEHGGRRYSPFVVNVERLKPWHTVTGRQQFYIDHDWLSESGEALPVFRPPLNMHLLYGEPELGQPDAEGLGLTVRYLTPHNKWSIHSEYQDNLLMLSLARGGQAIWMSTVDADKLGIKDNDWIEAVNRNGVIAARAIVSTRMPQGTVYMHHAQDRTINVPIAEASGKRGGIHNSATRILFKPSHVAGGYGQISWAFNTYGPTGNQRDEVTVIRRRSQEVTY
ncbi:nitrate reductase subunit alpha [Mobilicoccus caccae]|uniref:Nitrate reductase subunit alpha n=1 Tax=Mobilicoccus caccae TaxID=1859295 RepID=A0ABQ6ITL6_9MICO|nr:nitrate reductase subunit alpha [Mobilicoccus caccae]